jgi:hypothetical protein
MFDARFSKGEFQDLIHLGQKQMLFGLKVLYKEMVSNDKSGRVVTVTRLDFLIQLNGLS